MTRQMTRLLGLFTLLALAAVARAEIRVVDDLGHELTLDRPATRVVSLAPNITESLFAVGAGGLIVATVNYSDYPEEALLIPQIGAFNRVNIESVVGYKPDLVLATHSGNGGEVIERLRALGLKVYAADPRRLEGIARNLSDFAALTGRGAEGAAAADRFSARLGRLRATYAGAAPVTALYQVWNDPLTTVNDKHMIADLIRVCGGVNAFGEAIPLLPVISVEAVLKADPQVIIASGMGEERPDWVDQWRRWPSLTAVRDNHLYFIPPSLLQRYSVRILDGAEQMCGFLQQARQTLEHRP
ncbi:MAG: cobalamin-binding protein [Porticoccaceae bacterium]